MHGYLWGLSSDDVGGFIRENEPGSGKRSILRIGQQVKI